MPTKGMLVLIVDDEPTILDTLRGALEDASYEVASASNGADAIALLKSQGRYFRAVVTDVNLSCSITGWDVAVFARSINPTLPVIYITGADGRDWCTKRVPESVLLPKPFAMAQLVAAVTQAIILSSSPESSPAVAA